MSRDGPPAQFQWNYSQAAPEPVAGHPTHLGNYEIREELARGGMGAVYRAWDPRLQREVAIKAMLQPERGGHSKRFQREAHALARLRHPNVVQLHAVEEQDGLPYLVMKLVEGDTLEERLSMQGPLEPRAAARMIRKLALALHHAHGHSVLHRDVKPSNVILVDSDEPVLTDFGLTRDLTNAQLSLTQTGAIMGTPGYLSPEQATGGKVDRRSDVYGLGATLYATLTGSPPVQGASMLELMVATIEATVVPPKELEPRVPERLNAICLKCLQKAPEDRYPSCEELALELEAFQAASPWDRARPVLLASVFDEVPSERATPPPSAPAAPPPAALPPAAPPSTPQANRPSKPAPSPLHTLVHAAPSKSVFVADGEAAVIMGNTGTAFWNLQEETLTHFHQPGSPIYDLAVTTDGERVAYGGGNQVLWIADARSGELLETLKQSFTIYGVALSPDGRLVAVGGESGAVRLIDTTTGRLVQSLEHYGQNVHAIAFSPDGELLAIGAEARASKGSRGIRGVAAATLWRRSDDRPGYDRPRRITLISKPMDVAFEPSAAGFAVADRGGFLHVLSTREGVDALQFIDPEVPPKYVLGLAHIGRVRGVVYLDGGQRLLSAGDGGRVHSGQGGLKLWDVRTGKLLGVYQTRARGFSDLALSPDGERVILTRHKLDIVEVWELSTVLSD